MVEIAEMSIRGNMDTSDIDRGFQRVNQGFQKIEGQSKASLAPIGMLAGVMGKLVGSFVAIGTTGVAAMTALATKAPAVAPAIAKMNIEMIEMSHTLGKIMSPVFNAVANELLPALNTAIEDNSNFFKLWGDIAETAIDGVVIAVDKLAAKNVAKGIFGFMEKKEEFFENLGLPTKGGDFGWEERIIGLPTRAMNDAMIKWIINIFRNQNDKDTAYGNDTSLVY